MPEEALESELNIDPERFEKVFAQVWGENEDPEDRVHVDTEVESEIIRVVDDWAEHVHETAGGSGSTDGLFLVIEGAEATGKTTMTRYVKNSLSAVENPDRRDIPLIIPVWDNIDPNQTPYKFRSLLNSEGRRVFESLDGLVPDIDEKITALNSMSAETPDDQVDRLSDEWDATPEQVRGILASQHSGGDREPKDVVSELAQEGYVFVFIFDEMVSSSDKEEAQSVLKWFKDHLYPYVGFVLFCHPDVSDAIRREMRDQARRRNFEASLEIAGENHDLKEDIIIDIRGEQDRIIDLHQLLQSYFAAVSLDGVEDYGPFNEGNVEWMNSLLQSGGLIGNLIDGVKPAIKEYARALAEGDEEKDIGVYLFDECSRMEHVRIRQRLDAHTDLDSRADEPLVWRAKELITGSIEIDDLEPDEQDALKEHRVLFEDSESGDLKITPTLIEYGDVERRPQPSNPQLSDEDFLRVYEGTLRDYTDKKTDPDQREELRRNLEMGVSTLVGHLNSRQVNIANRGGLALPGQSHVPTGYMEISSAGTTGRANKLQITDGEYADYGYSFLTYALLDTESLSSPDVQDAITDLYSGENGIIVFTDKDPEDVETPDWFETEIDRQHWNDPSFEWGDIIEIVHVASLSEVHGVYEHISDRGVEEDSEILAEIDRLDDEPTTPALFEMLDAMYNDIASSIQNIHDQIYAKYEGPTLPEAEAFTEILGEVQEKGFISEEDVNRHQEEYGAEIASLKEKGALVSINGEGPDTVVFLQKDFGRVSKLAGRNVNGPDDLFPVPPAVFEELDEFREMEADRVEDEEDEIEDALSELEDKKKWIDHFLFEDEVASEIEDTIDDLQVDVFADVKGSLEEARDTAEEDYNSVCDILSADRDLWDRIRDLDVDTDVSPIHRGLFYARLHQQAPPWAEDFLETDGDYPDLFFELRDQIGSVLEAIDRAKEEVEDGFSDESDDFNELSGEIAEFMDIDTGDDSVELNNSDVDQLQDKGLDELEDVDFAERLSAIAENETKRKNLSRATRFLTDANSAVVDELEDGLNVDTIEDIDDETAEEYIPVGQAIATRLIEEDVVFKDTNEPDLVIGELKRFCEDLRELVQETRKKERLESDLAEQLSRIESLPGDSMEEKETYLEEKEAALKEAKRLLKLKDGHCEVCQTEWDNLTEERREEISENIEQVEDEYDVSLSLATADEKIDSVKDEMDTFEDARSKISRIRSQLGDIDIDEHREALSELKEKYESND